MTAILQDVLILWGPLYVSDQANKVELSRSVETRDATTYTAAGWRVKVPTVQSAEAKASGFASFTTFETGGAVFDKELFDRLASATAIPLTVAATDDDGAVAYVMAVTSSRFRPFAGPVTDLAAFDADWQSTRKGLGRGSVLHPVGTTRTASGTGTGRQTGAVSSTQRLVAGLHVISATGTTPTLDVIVESDSAGGFGTPTTRLTFAQKTAAGSEYLEAAGAITDDWWRIGWTIGGTDPVFRFVVAIGII